MTVKRNARVSAAEEGEVSSEAGTLLNVVPGSIRAKPELHEANMCSAGNVDYNMYSSFLTASPGSVLFSRSNLLKRKDLCFSCLRLGLIRHRRSKRSSHLFSK